MVQAASVSQYADFSTTVGRTICLGQRLAKLQLKLITALMLMKMDFVLVDENGDQPHILPRPNWNDTLTCKPPKGSCYLRFECADATKTHTKGLWSDKL